MPATHARPVDCPSWCDLDHYAQRREIDALSHLPGDNDPWHTRNLARGHDTDSHGPIYEVHLERSGGQTRLWSHLETVNLSADQAEVFGLALVRAAYLLRSCPDASSAILLDKYWDGTKLIDYDRCEVEPTSAEEALHGERA